MTDLQPSLVPLVSFVILIAIIGIVGRILISTKWRHRTISHLKDVALWVLIFGWIIYVIGYWQYYDEKLNLVALVFRSFLSSVGMFALQSDLQYFIQESVKESPLFLGIFAIIHFLAALVSAIFLVNVVGFKLVSWMKMRRADGQDLFIFWGLNDNSITLAEDIHRKQVNGLVIFVGTAQDSDNGNHELSVSSLINGKTQRKDRIRKIEEELNAVITYCTDELPSESNMIEGDNILGKIKLWTLAKIIAKSKEFRVRFFFLSDNEGKNLEYISSFLCAISKKDVVLSECKQLDLYCKARKNKENGVFEKLAYLKKDQMVPNVHLVDSANLSVQMLKKNVAYQPVSFVDVKINRAAVDSQFTALVLGFGATGRDAVRFLYEFGALPDVSGKKSPFKCYVLDRRMDELKGTFYNNSPSLKGKSELELQSTNVLSIDFWERVKSIIDNINYIVIALGDDHLGIQIAIDLLELAYKHRRTLHHFKIFIRSYDQESEAKMEEMVRFYHDKTEGNIVMFGKVGDLYSFSNIVDDESLKEAMTFYAGYANAATIKEKWEERHMMKNKKKEDITLGDINAILRKERQDIANSMHIDTKLALVGMTRNSNGNMFDSLSDAQLRNIAICEHLRWNASHEVLGYIYSSKTDDLRKTHQCLREWDDLSKEYQSYDYEVWEQTKAILKSKDHLELK